MPELPEVEICRRNLWRWTRGRALREVQLLDPGAIRPKFSTRPSLAMEDGEEAIQRLVGHPAVEPIRHGKRIGWTFGPHALGVHLGMTGVFRPGDPPRFARVGMRFDHDWLWFVDMRRFGCLVPSTSEDIGDLISAGHGPDALIEPLDGPALERRMQTRKPIKVALLDQHRLTGIGNIHAIEALFRIGVAPTTPAKQLAKAQWEALAEMLRTQLEEAITAQDSPDFSYITDGGPNVFRIYGREGEDCPKCTETIIKTTLGGRGTFHCPQCQAT